MPIASSASAAACSCAKTAVDQHQAREGLLLFLQFGVAARDHFAHGGEIVVANDGADDEFAVVGLLHLAVFPHHHAGDFVGALDVRDIETFDAPRRLGQVQSILQRLLDGFRRRLHHAETLIEAVLGVGLHQSEQALSSIRAAALQFPLFGRADRKGTLRVPRGSSKSAGTWMWPGMYWLFEIDLFQTEPQKIPPALKSIWSSQKNSRRSTILPLRRWNRLTATSGGSA